MDPFAKVLIAFVAMQFIVVAMFHFRIITKNNNNLYRFPSREVWLFPKLGLRWLPDALMSLSRKKFETEDPYEFSDTVDRKKGPITVRLKYIIGRHCERGQTYTREDLNRAPGEKVAEYLMDRVAELELAKMPTMSEPWQEDMRRAINYVVEGVDIAFEASISSLTITIKEGVVQADINSAKEVAVSFSPTPNED